MLSFVNLLNPTKIVGFPLTRQCQDSIIDTRLSEERNEAFIEGKIWFKDLFFTGFK